MLKGLALFAVLLILFSGCATNAPLADPSAGIVVETLVRSTQSWDGESLPAYPEGPPQVSVLRITIPPGVALPEHQHPVINAGVLLSGTIEVNTEDGDTIRVEAGDGLIEVVNEWHAGRNIGNEPAVVVVVYAGSEGVPLSVRRDPETVDGGETR